MSGFGRSFGSGWGGGSLPVATSDPLALVAPVPGAPDLITQGRSRIIQQYKDKPKLAAELDMILSAYQDLANALVLIPQLDDLDFATGVNLTVTAALIGQARVLPNGSTVSDDLLRILAKARILRNRSHGTGEDIIAVAFAIFGVEIRFISFGYMSINVMVGRDPTVDEISALQADILPRPAAVQMTVGSYVPGGFFGFFGTTGALGFEHGAFASLFIP